MSDRSFQDDVSGAEQENDKSLLGSAVLSLAKAVDAPVTANENAQINFLADLRLNILTHLKHYLIGKML